MEVRPEGEAGEVPNYKGNGVNLNGVNFPLPSPHHSTATMRPAIQLTKFFINDGVELKNSDTPDPKES